MRQDGYGSALQRQLRRHHVDHRAEQDARAATGLERPDVQDARSTGRRLLPVERVDVDAGVLARVRMHFERAREEAIYQLPESAHQSNNSFRAFL